MLGPGRYLLGVVEIGVIVVPAWLGAARVRARLVPSLEGTPAHLATALLAIAALIWAAELLGSVGIWQAVPYLVLVAAAGTAVWLLVGDPDPEVAAEAAIRRGREPRYSPLLVAIALLVAAIAVVHFAGGVRDKLGTGMTGFDSTWYHGPFAAGFFQGGDTWHLHFIAPQFLAWFYPANSEVLHAAGMLAFGRDVLSPLLNLGWFAGCLVACWAIGRPFRVAPWSLALGAIALSVPALSDQAGEARNDIVGIFFLLAAIAVALNAWAAGSVREHGPSAERQRLDVGALVVVGLGAGLAAGTKLNFLLPAAVLVAGLLALAPRGSRWRALAAAALPAIAGGGYWYLRNLVHAGNPLPWIHHLGPISLPAPSQALGGREAHNVLGYLTDGSVWSDWFLPGLHHGLWIVWPLLGLGALAGLVLPLIPRRVRRLSRIPGQTTNGRGAAAGVLALAGLVGLATGLAWLLAPTSASGPDGMPRGFESGLRYLAPALVLGLALLPAARPLRGRLASLLPAPRSSFVTQRLTRGERTPARVAVAALVLALAAVVAVGYPVERHYLASRYKDPSFTTPGLNAAFAWARNVSDARIATTSTRQYPLFGTELSNQVEYLGEKTADGGFEAPPGCRDFIRLLNQGHFDYLVASRDRIEPGKPPYPPQAGWVEGAGAEVVLREPPTVVFRLAGPLSPAACP